MIITKLNLREVVISLTFLLVTHFAFLMITRLVDVELLFSLFFPIHVCHAGKKAGVTTSGTYKRGWDGTLLSYSLQGPKPPGNPRAYRLPIIRISLLSSVDAFVVITDQFCFSPSSILDALCFHPPPPPCPNLSHTSSSLVYTEVYNLRSVSCALTFTGLTF